MTLLRWIVTTIATVAVTLTLTGPAQADDWPAPQPVSFHARGMEHVVEIFPPFTNLNTTKQPIGILYKMSSGGERGASTAQVIWRSALANSEMPYEAVVSMDGRVITLDDYANLGAKHAVVVYRPDGTLVRSLALDEIMPAAEQSRVKRSESSTWWRKEARYFFVEHPHRLFITLPIGGAAEINLEDGKTRYEPVAKFPDLGPLLANGGNAEAEIWRTSLRFSSITAQQAAHPPPSVAPPRAAAPPAPAAPAVAPPSAASPTAPTRGGACAGCTLSAQSDGEQSVLLVAIAIAIATLRRDRGVRRRGI